MKKRWLTSKELIDRWQAEPFEILEAHKNGLPFCLKSGKIATYPLNSEDHKPEKLNLAQRRELEKYDEYLLDDIFLDYEPISDPFDQAMGEDVEVAKFRLTDIEAYEQKHGICPDADATTQKFLEEYKKPKGKSIRQSTKDMEALKTWVKSLGENPPGVADLARQAKQNPKWEVYTEKTLERQIRPVHPSYTPGKPGRKKTN